MGKRITFEEIMARVAEFDSLDKQTQRRLRQQLRHAYNTAVAGSTARDQIAKAYEDCFGESVEQFANRRVNEPAAFVVDAPRSMWATGPSMKIQVLRDSTYGQLGKVNSPGDAADLIRQAIGGDAVQEHVVVIMLDTRNNVIGTAVVYVGTANTVVIDIKDILLPAILTGAKAIVMGHNHPSDDPTPSPEDIKLTRELAKVCKMLGLDLLDHVIVSTLGHRSLKADNFFN